MIDKKSILYLLLGIVIFAAWEIGRFDANIGQINTKNIVEKHSENKLLNTNNYFSFENNYSSIKTFIKVKTDVLNILIDPQGGNIVQADLLKYPEVIYKEKPIRIFSNKKDIYYVPQSYLVSDFGINSSDQNVFYSTQKNEYLLKPTDNSLKIELFLNNKDGVKIKKIFNFTRNKYDISVCYEINNDSNKLWHGKYYSRLLRKDFGNAKSWFSSSGYTGAAISSKDVPYKKLSFSDIEKASKKGNFFVKDNYGGWVAMQQRYFLGALIPISQNDIYSYFAKMFEDNEKNKIYGIGFCKDMIVAPHKKNIIGSTLYVGPEIADNLSILANGLERTIDYGWIGIWFIAIGLFWLLKNLNKFVCNWGFSIILITTFVKLVFYKLSESSYRSMIKMKELMPKIQKIREHYSNDHVKLQESIMELYKKEKINPLNFGGCLPMIIQMPFFIALYYVLLGAIELRHAPFILWLDDLSAKDPYFVLPFLMGLSMFIQQKLSASSLDPMQAKMIYIMPIAFTIFFINLPSGLVLYWLFSNLLSISQQWYINKKFSNKINNV